MVVDEVLLNGAVETFGVGIHFGGTGVSPPVRDAVLLEFVIELSHELGAIVGQYKARCGGQEWAEGFECEGGLTAGLGTGGEGEGESAVGVNEGEQVAPDAIADADHGIAGEDGERGVVLAFGFTVFAVPMQGFASSLWRKSGGGMAQLVGFFGDDSPDGGDAGQRQGVLVTPGDQ